MINDICLTLDTLVNTFLPWPIRSVCNGCCSSELVGNVRAKQHIVQMRQNLLYWISVFIFPHVHVFISSYVPVLSLTPNQHQRFLVFFVSSFGYFLSSIISSLFSVVIPCLIPSFKPSIPCIMSYVMDTPQHSSIISFMALFAPPSYPSS